MRPPVKRQSALCAPLNDMLATEGTVRILRELSATRSPMSAGTLSEAARLERSTARRALGVLLDTGIASVHGRAKSPQYSLRGEHPLAPAITALFHAERERAEKVKDEIKRAIQHLSPPPKAAWLEGAVALEIDEPGEPLVVRIIGSANAIEQSVIRLRAALAPLEAALDVTINVVGSTPADLMSHRENDPRWEDKIRSARSFMGLPPAAYLPQEEQTRPQVRSHADLDARAHSLAREIARRLKHDPELICRALDFVENRLADASSGERQELEEWRQLLRTASPMRIRRFLLDEGERATRLRQTLPFVGMLTPDERASLHAAAKRGISTGSDL
jgi:DNA-binding transcriptional ArsR family regulator